MGEKDIFSGEKMGEKMLDSAQQVYNEEFEANLGINYLGRVDFGQGNIDASNVTVPEFMGQLDYIGTKGLVRVPDMLQVYGGCMDGRGNMTTLAGNQVPPRPKVIGGPSLFSWYVASLGNFKVLDGESNPTRQFERVNTILHNNGFRLGMHVGCGAAAGVEPILGNYNEQYENITNVIGSEARELIKPDGPVSETGIREGIFRTRDRVSTTSDFNEENMHRIIRRIDGDDTVIKLDADHSHATHGHDEEGLLYLRVNNGVAFKDKINRETGRQVFYQNMVYASRIIDALALDEAEKSRGLVIAEQLPVAGVATLGKGQHVGEISGSI